MKTLGLYLKLIGIRVLQGLQKVGVIALGIVGVLSVWNIATGYFKEKAVPSFGEIITLLLCVVGIIVLLTLKKIIEAKLTDINDGILRPMAFSDMA